MSSITKTDSVVNYAGTGNAKIGIYSARSEVIVHTGNGHGGGGTGDKIRRFVTTQTNVGSAITYADSATNGASFTINAAGIYAVTYSDRANGAATALWGISKNASSLTTSLDALAVGEIVQIVSVALQVASTQGDQKICSCVMSLQSGDIIRAHTDGTLDQATAPRAKFHIIQLYAYSS